MTPLPRPAGLSDAEAAELLARTARAWFSAPPANDNPQGFLTTGQAAAFLGCSRLALLRRIARGKIRPDVWAREDGVREHLFRKETLEAVAKTPRTVSNR